eukprot:1146678-Pelagomonas_calceolata.AAC.4
MLPANMLLAALGQCTSKGSSTARPRCARLQITTQQDMLPLLPSPEAPGAGAPHYHHVHGSHSYARGHRAHCAAAASAAAAGVDDGDGGCDDGGDGGGDDGLTWEEKVGQVAGWVGRLEEEKAGVVPHKQMPFGLRWATA